MCEAGELTFAVVDDMALGAPVGDGAASLAARELGPLVELLLLREQDRISETQENTILRQSGFWSVLTLGTRDKIVELTNAAGYLRLGTSPPAEALTHLSIVTKRAAVAAGYDQRTSGMLSAAVGEIAGNIIEHSGATETGIVAYQGRQGVFEFVVADQGMGALNSLRCNARFEAFQDDREALPKVLEHGVSRFDAPGRGAGFDMMFQGLANHNGRLRFRSGEALVTIDGRDPRNIPAKVKRRPHLQGFFASASCAV